VGGINGGGSVIGFTKIDAKALLALMAVRSDGSNGERHLSGVPIKPRVRELRIDMS
jgi:hypothetical protein